MLHLFHWCRNKNFHPRYDDGRMFFPNLGSILQWFFGDSFSSLWVSRWKCLSLLHLASRTRRWAFTFHPHLWMLSGRRYRPMRAWLRAAVYLQRGARHWDATNTERSWAQGSARASGIAWAPSGNLCSWILPKVYGLSSWVNLEKVEGLNFDRSIWLSHGKVN